MAMAIIGLVLYLSALAKFGKSLKEKNASARRRVGFGIVAGIVPLAWPLLLGYFNPWVLGWSALFGVLGYITVAHAPRWIIGAPKSDKQKGASA